MNPITASIAQLHGLLVVAHHSSYRTQGR